MRVLHAIISPGQGGGAENAAMELARTLRADGLDVTVARMSQQDGEESDGGLIVKNCKVRDVPLLPKPYSNVFTRSDLAREVVQGRYDLVHLHNTHPALALWEVARRCLRQGVPYLVTTHGLVETLDSKNIFRTNFLLSTVINWTVERPLRLTLQRASRVAALCRSELSLLKALGVPESLVEPIYNGANDRLLNGRFKRQNMRAKLGIRPGQPMVLFVGNIKKNKGVEVLLRAVPWLDSATVVIAGQPTQPGYAQTLSQLLDQLGVRRRVLFTGYLSDDELYSLYGESSVFVLPTYGDTFPLVVLDAMSAKKPVVASAIGGIPEQLGTDAGFTVSAGDERALAEKVNVLLRNPDLARTMGEAGHRRVLERFTWARVAKNAQAIYNALL